MVIGSAVLNAAAFIGGNYVAKYLSGESRKATLEEETRHDKALKAYQAAYALSTHATAQTSSTGIQANAKIKEQAEQNFTKNDNAFKLYNQTQPDNQITLPESPASLIFISQASSRNKGALIFVGGRALALGYAALRAVFFQ